MDIKDVIISSCSSKFSNSMVYLLEATNIESTVVMPVNSVAEAVSANTKVVIINPDIDCRIDELISSIRANNKDSYIVAIVSPSIRDEIFKGKLGDNTSNLIVMLDCTYDNIWVCHLGLRVVKLYESIKDKELLYGWEV